MAKKGYVGRISNAGTQFVPGPNVKRPAPRDKVKTGNDLRSRKK